MGQDGKTFAAEDLDADCRELLDRAEHGDLLVVTRDGRPFVRIVPIAHVEPGSLTGSIVRESDVLSSVWER